MTQTPPSPHEPDDDLAELIEADRELTPAEQGRLKSLAGAGWAYVNRFFSGRSRETYAMAAPVDFAECVFDHMDIGQRAELITADVYSCPGCGRLLKDRKNPVASSILLERRRLRELWLDVEAAPDDKRDKALERFRRALGLEQGS
jgi:hypothetical protein